MKINNITIGLLSCFLLFSCNDDFLTKTNPTKIGKSKFYSNEKQIRMALNGVYGQLQVIIGQQWLFNELPSDNTTIDFNPNDRGQASNMEQFEYWTVNPGTPSLETMYERYYNAIYNVNLILQKVETVEASDSLNKIKGQLKFFRAYYYFNLIRYFGDVILITEPLDNPSKAWKYNRKSQDVVYKQIKKDLKDAISFLPIKYEPNNSGRITKGAALTLLGKVYLTRKKYSKTVSTLRKVLKLGYSLLPSYRDVFDPKIINSNESIFEVNFQGGNDLGEWSHFIYTFAPRKSEGEVTGWPKSNPGGWNIPTNDLISSYEKGDLRKAASISLDFRSPVTGDIIPYIKKYQHPHKIQGRTGDDWPVLRYADVLLMLAEAINELSGPTSEAYKYLNMVRNRAGLSSLSGLDKITFRKAVYHERRVEFAFENHRWLFLKRTKTPEELAIFLNKYGKKEKANPTVTRQGTPFSNDDYVFQPYEVLYPIPAREIRVNKNIQQNPGYH